MFFPLINLITHCAVSKISVVGTDFYLLYVQNVTVLSQHNKLINPPPPKKNKRTNKQKQIKPNRLYIKTFMICHFCIESVKFIHHGLYWFDPPVATIMGLVSSPKYEPGIFCLLNM